MRNSQPFNFNWTQTCIYWAPVECKTLAGLRRMQCRDNLDLVAEPQKPWSREDWLVKLYNTSIQGKNGCNIAWWKYGVGKIQYTLSGGMREGWIPSGWGIWALKHNRNLIGLGGQEQGKDSLPLGWKIMRYYL